MEILDGVHGARWLVWVSGLLLLVGAGSASATVYFSGHISSSQNAPVAGAVVQAGTVDYAGHFVLSGSAVSDAQGDYAITTLDPQSNNGRYILALVSADYVTTVYPDRQCYFIGCLTGHPPPFPTEYAPPLAGVDFQAVRAALISGQITRADTAQPIPNISLGVELASDGYPPFASIMTDADARFTLKFPPGSYSLLAEPVDGVLLTQVYAQHDIDFVDTNITLGDVLTVQEGQIVSDVNFALHAGASISGKLTSAVDGAPAKASVVALHSGAASYGVEFTSDADGNYRVGPLVSGPVYFFFGGGNWWGQYYPGTGDWTQAQPVTVGAGQQLTGVDAQLTPTRSIAGTITDANTHVPVQGATVHALYTTSGFPMLTFEQSTAISDANGRYVLQNLESNKPYYVGVYGTSQYVCGYYGQAGSYCFGQQGMGTAVSLGAQEYRTGVDVALTKGATISGRVYDPDTGYAWPYANIMVSNADLWVTATSDAAGMYRTPAVPLGNYYVAVAVAQMTAYYPNCIGCTQANAQAQSLNQAQEYTNFDFSFPHSDLLFRANFEP